jgi:predicted nucleic acid-binding protein
MIAAKRAHSGCVVDCMDTLIAGIALSRKMDIATRNVRHFAGLETRALDPWPDA